MNDDLRKCLTEPILAWYARHRRQLPWRQNRDPYRIWVAEIMLQQTQVETVVPYYHRFVERFPTVQALAEACRDEVLKLWENMGYYTRARHLHAAARVIVDQWNGKIPDTREGLMGLPGIGQYTAGAILSMAFGRRVPAVDGNVRRVLSRIFTIREPIDQGQTQWRLWKLAEALVPEDDPGTFNQALMDLGATLCSPRNPTCPPCPIQDACLARQRGLQGDLPVRKKRSSPPHVLATAGLIGDGRDRVLIVQRAGRGLLGGLWKFPGGRVEKGEALQACLRRHIQEELGIKVRVGRSLTSVDHAYTHFRMTLHAFHCTHQAGGPEALACADWRWATPEDFHNLAFSKADRKVIQAIQTLNNIPQLCPEDA